jgi:hypothetical protein
VSSYTKNTKIENIEPQRKYKKRLLQVVMATTGYIYLAVTQYKFRSEARTVAKKGGKS